MRLLTTIGALAFAASALLAQPKPAAPSILDINTATAAQLETVPGIGAAYAKKIIAGRPYKSKDELTRKHVIPDGVYAKVKDHLVAKQSR